MKSAAELSSVDPSTKEKTDDFVLDDVCSKIEDSSSQAESFNDDRMQTTVNQNKDPALWEINDTLREIIARCGFDQNKSSDFSKSEKKKC